MADVPKLVGIALQDDHRRAELTRMQAELKARGDEQAAHLKVGAELARFAAANPGGARAVDQVYLALAEGRMTPEQVLAQLGGQGTSEGQGQPVPPTSGQPADAQTRAALAAIEAKLQSVESSVQQRERLEAERARNSEIEAALARDTFLRTRPGAAKIVRERISSRMQTENLSLQDAVAAEVTTFKAALEEDQTIERDRLLGQQNLGTVQTNRGIPQISAPDYSKIPATAGREERKGLMMKGIKAAAMEAAVKLRNAALSGPS